MEVKEGQNSSGSSLDMDSVSGSPAVDFTLTVCTSNKKGLEVMIVFL